MSPFKQLTRHKNYTIKFNDQIISNFRVYVKWTLNLKF